MDLKTELEELYKVCIPEKDESQLTIHVNGEEILNSSSGIERDSLLPIFSVSKILCALVVADLIKLNLINLDSEISKYWPEFGNLGKEKITLRQLLSHQAGLPETRKGLTIDELLSNHGASKLLANEQPLWEPGQAFGYHGLTIGNLLSEIVYQVTNLSLQEYFNTKIKNIINTEVYLGLPKELHHRFHAPLPPDELMQEENPYSLNSHVFRVFNENKYSNNSEKLSLFSKAGLQFGHPAAGGVANAKSLAEMMDWALGFGRPSPGINSLILEDMIRIQSEGYDLVLDQSGVCFGSIFMRPTKSKPFGSFRSFGHDGATGSIVFADLSNGLVFSYLVRRFTAPGGFDSRLLPIIRHLYKRIAF